MLKNVLIPQRQSRAQSLDSNVFFIQMHCKSSDIQQKIDLNLNRCQELTFGMSFQISMFGKQSSFHQGPYNINFCCKLQSSEFISYPSTHLSIHYHLFCKDTEPLYHSFMYSLVSLFFTVSIHYLQCIYCLLHQTQKIFNIGC